MVSDARWPLSKGNVHDLLVALILMNIMYLCGARVLKQIDQGMFRENGTPLSDCSGTFDLP